MLLKKLTYQNKQSGLTLQDVTLDRFNLLVGASGVGKTQILRALRSIQRLARDGHAEQPMSFSITFEHGNRGYTWNFESTAGGQGLEITSRVTGASPTSVLREKLTSSEEGVLIERDHERFFFKGTKLPQLSRAETALSLIDEQSILTARHALTNRIIDDPPHLSSYRIPRRLYGPLYFPFQTLEDLQDFNIQSALFAAFLLQEQFPEQFNQIKTTYIEIFPSIEDVAVEQTDVEVTSSKESSDQRLSFKLKEHGIPHWVPAEDISSGMLRTLIHLIELTLAPKDSVVLIDEFENSLGVNCMGPLTDFILSRAPELQFIITSHHPYIINKIPKEHWKLVRRHGSTVRVTPASEIRALQGASAQDDFIRLINAPEFEEGVS